MSRLGKLMGAPIKVTLEGEDFDIYPLKMADLPLLMRVSSKDPEVQGKAVGQMVKKTLRKAVPEATDVELDEISMKYFNELVSVIMKANGIEQDELPAKKSLQPQKEE